MPSFWLELWLGRVGYGEGERGLESAKRPKDTHMGTIDGRSLTAAMRMYELHLRQEDLIGDKDQGEALKKDVHCGKAEMELV